MRNRFVIHSHTVPELDGSFDPSTANCLDEAGLPYFGRVLHHLSELIEPEGLTFFITTFNVADVPEMGDRVISCILEDELSREVCYRDKVGGVIRCYPNLPSHMNGIRGLKPVHRAGAFAVVVRDFLRGYQGRIATQKAKLQGRKLAPIMEMPIGCNAYSTTPVDFIPFEERTCDLFFRGSINHLSAQRVESISAWFRPKSRERLQMKNAVDQVVKKHPDIAVSQGFTASFEDSVASSRFSYLSEMMNAKFCLAPRGGAPHTFRFFEALRYGTIPIGETFPSSFEGAPFIRLKNWKDLEKVVPALLEDKALLSRMHSDAIAWWKEQASEEVVARRIAEWLDKCQLAKAAPASVIKSSESELAEIALGSDGR